jgi:hypothetical protein
MPPKKQIKRIIKNMQTVKQLKDAVRHAKLVCYNYEDTHECKVAWQKVDALVSSLRDNDTRYDD